MSELMQTAFERAARAVSEVEYGEVNVRLIVDQGIVVKVDYSVTQDTQTVDAHDRRAESIRRDDVKTIDV